MSTAAAQPPEADTRTIRDATAAALKSLGSCVRATHLLLNDRARANGLRNGLRHASALSGRCILKIRPRPRGRIYAVPPWRGGVAESSCPKSPGPLSLAASAWVQDCASHTLALRAHDLHIFLSYPKPCLYRPPPGSASIASTCSTEHSHDGEYKVWHSGLCCACAFTQPCPQGTGTCIYLRRSRRHTTHRHSKHPASHRGAVGRTGSGAWKRGHAPSH